MKPKRPTSSQLDLALPESGPGQLALGLDAPQLPPLQYRLRRNPRAGSTASVRIRREGDVLEVSAPRDMSLSRIEDTLRSKVDAPERNHLLPDLPEQWAAGTRFVFQGRECGVRLAGDNAAALIGDELVLPLPGDAQASRIRDQVHAWLQGEAQRVLSKRLAFCAVQARCGMPAWKLTFSHRVLAGVDKGVLRLHWKLVLLPLAEIDAAILRAWPAAGGGVFEDLFS